MWWEKDLKGKGRTIEDGANYRFNMTIGFPEGVDKAEGEKWLFEKVVPILQDSSGVYPCTCKCSKERHQRMRNGLGT